MTTADVMVHVPRDPGTVFEFLRDPARAPEWRALVTRMVPLGPLPLDAGSRVQLHFAAGGVERMQEITLTECDAPHRQCWRNESEGFVLEVRLLLTPHGAGTDLRALVDTRGARWSTRLLLPFVTRGHRQRFRDSLERVRRALTP